MRFNKDTNWIPIIFLCSYHFALFISLPFYLLYVPNPSGLLIFSIILLFLTGISITGGYHRYFSHKTFKTNKYVEFILLLFGSMTAQGSALRWAFDHRIHHAFVDTDNDPYSIKKGFWYAHFLWILKKPKKIDPKIVSDLLKNKLVCFQHEYYPLCLVTTNSIVVLLAYLLFDDFLGSIILAFGLRLFLLHHFTWFINSLAHTWGDKPFCQEQSAVNNYIIALLTFGEGYHNFHHTFANDYRNGIKWYHYDPTKWFIWILFKCNLAHSLKEIDSLTIKKRMILERKTILTQKLKVAWYLRKDAIEEKIEEISNSIVTSINKLYLLKKKCNYLRKNKAEKNHLMALKKELKELKKRLRRDWKQWKNLSALIMTKVSC
ncbi:Fatty acid desaturase [Candidatus Rubidus massiliensis]|nr:Fatty acid desaturase [Candidatus Rubidus massiliensis]